MFQHPHYQFDSTTLYDQLMALCDGSDVFYSQDHTYEGHTYRIFNYRLATYGDFLLPGALESRGHTFRLRTDGWPPVLVSLPMEKFFNLGENPFTMDLDLSKVIRVEDKRDGSLISTVRLPQYDDVVHVKSKGSFSSDQAKAAYTMLNYGDEYWEFAKLLRSAIGSNYTVNMEYTAPSNQIVVGYTKAALTVLNIRDNATGAYIDPINFGFPAYWVADYQDREVDQTWLEMVEQETGKEGYIIQFDNGLKVKIKNDWYRNLHLQKEQVSQPRRLFEAVLHETSDDLKGLFAADPQSIQRIEAMEELVKREYNRLANIIDTFYTENRELSRKDYAVLGQQVLVPHGVFSQAMNLYLGNPHGLKDNMIKNYKKFIGDDVVSDE